MGATPKRKPLLALGGVPVLEVTCAAFAAAATVAEVLIVAHPSDVEAIERLCAERPALDKVRGVVTGGAERADSVRCGVRWCGFGVDVICVHDAARPLVRPDQIDATVRRAADEGAALLGVPVRDTVKGTGDGRFAERTLDRSSLWAAQTPQAFAARAFREVLEESRRDGYSPTDDAALWERYRGPVALVEGDLSNFKITTPADLALAEAVLASRRQGAHR